MIGLAAHTLLVCFRGGLATLTSRWGPAFARLGKAQRVQFVTGMDPHQTQPILASNASTLASFRRWRWGAIIALIGVVLCGAWLAAPSWIFSSELPALCVLVEGVAPRSVVSTFGASRDGGKRKHRGTDIFAPLGTPVVAASRGYVVRIGNDSLGGRVAWIVGEGQAAYYYAHLDGWKPDLHVGQRLSAGDVIGWVGNTGNARNTPPHLHFGVYQRRGLWWVARDPAPLLWASVTR
ncbi:MAG: M23 family metallopeptidase [Myxococcaceae bacterium]